MPANDNDIFATTRWTMVLHAGRAGANTKRAGEALRELCQAYWYPIYAFVRSRGHSPHDAEDLTQSFLARLLRPDFLMKVSPDRGKFRAFLLASLKNFMTDEWRAAAAGKRDRRLTISLDAAAAEERFAREPADSMTPDKLYERKWALTLLESAMRTLERRYREAGKDLLFRELRFCVAGEKSAVPYRELAARLKMSEPALRVAVHRLRRDYRDSLNAEIAQTVSDPGEIEEELLALRRVLAET